MNAVITPERSDPATRYESGSRRGSDGFGPLIRSEWTKFRTVRAWVLTIVVAAAAALGLSVFLSSNGQNCPGSCSAQAPPTGPDGTPVTDAYYLVHQSMGASGSVSARVTSLTNVSLGTGVPGGSNQPSTIEPWAKAGIIITASTAPGSTYAAVMVTADYGVRLQYDYTHDVAGPMTTVSAATPEWLRLTRSGDKVTALASRDGAHWTVIGTVTLRGLPDPVQVGMFVASPDSAELHQANLLTEASGTFDDVAVSGGTTSAQWRGGQVGPHLTGDGRNGYYIEPGQEPRPGSFSETGGTFGIEGSGDLGPYVPPEDALGNSLIGLIVALIAVIAVATLFVTAEYRRGLIRTTLSASPRRGRVLGAKVVVIASVAFIVGLVAAAIDLPLAEHTLRSHGDAPPWWLTNTGTLSGTGLRIVLGTGALFALAAALAVGVGIIARRGAAAVTTAFVVIVLPVVLMFTLPAGAARLVQTYTPAAVFSVQSSIPRYQQMTCFPTKGCFALAPWAGFGVFAVYAAVTLTVAFALVRTRDAG